jgi:hypothetical protein
MVTKERWEAAQVEERKFHTEGFHEGREHYGITYEQYFKYLGIEKDLQGKNIVEIGPADFPALAYCENLGPNCLVIEPMPSENLKLSGLTILQDIAEEAVYEADEVWLMNVLQHVIDPHKIVDRAKQQSKVIRYFEPVNYGTDVCHPWNLTKEMFEGWFGEVNYYPKNTTAVWFHTWECVYGVWQKK